MEFCKVNFLETSSQITINSSTDTSSFLFSKDKNYQYVSDGLDSDLTTLSITISFDETTTISRLGVLNHNVKSFSAFYNGATANTFQISGATSTLSFTTNSATNSFFQCTSVDCTSVTFDFKTTIEANAEKAIGYLYVSDLLLDFDRIPDAGSYSPVIIPRQVVHTMADGGKKIQKISEKWASTISFKYIETSFRDDLKGVYDLQSSIVFVPFPTTTSWDGVFFESIWSGNFNFYKYSDDAASAGFSGNIKLEETSY